KAKELIENADVVVYDALAGDGILAMIPSTAECINAGKRSSKHILPQHETNRVLCEKAKEGKRVVRIKGGDPYLFGRGGEEAEYLLENGVEFEEVPGVTSSIAVPAYNGIPVTHRDFASSVTLITGHKKQDEELDIDFKALTDLNGTIVFMMGLTALPDIMKGLLSAGMNPDMPAAVLSKGTTARQQRRVATISTIEKMMEDDPVPTPAIIVVGKVCTLNDKLCWIEKQELFGKKIIVTRPKSRSGKLAGKLRALGAEVVEIPSITLEAIKDNKAFENALDNIKTYTWIVFTSPSGVHVFFDTLREKKVDIRGLAGIKFAAIGSGTAKELSDHAVFCDVVPDVFDNETLANALKNKMTAEDKVLIPRASIGNPILTEILGATPAGIDDIPVYETLTCDYEWLDLSGKLKDVDYVTFTSASTVDNFVKLAGKDIDYSKVLGVCIGKQTREMAEKYGFKTIMSEKATIDSMVECILKER
ncbi:MAG: uroporphyrinogen-III C-methyltransferase, partial [Lachnospiraceae bacterium]|nr:uroporphyrinogen-III C-methyltransferase [Lachnospiraceae bacterium]